ncbi:hypothetical protein NDU88_009009 [Pleurodeles waltl]|uniref:Uncharacterized protein n=1 Tax=Pleurodeles waltl TaxID=8319 RepID=A0AAV7QQF0_PLEWA|nr:hypothetical protein NDU88_009009 [Pleurodeles waltl]
MSKDKGGWQSQVSKIVTYAQVTHSKDKMVTNTLEDTQGAAESGDPQEPSMSDILNKIKGTHKRKTLLECLTGRVTIELDGTLAADRDDMYGQSTLEDRQRHIDPDTDATEDGQP